MPLFATQHGPWYRHASHHLIEFYDHNGGLQMKLTTELTSDHRIKGRPMGRLEARSIRNNISEISGGCVSLLRLDHVYYRMKSGNKCPVLRDKKKL